MGFKDKIEKFLEERELKRIEEENRFYKEAAEKAAQAREEIKKLKELERNQKIIAEAEKYKQKLQPKQNFTFNPDGIENAFGEVFGSPNEKKRGKKNGTTN